MQICIGEIQAENTWSLNKQQTEFCCARVCAVEYGLIKKLWMYINILVFTEILNDIGDAKL